MKQKAVAQTNNSSSDAAGLVCCQANIMILTGTSGYEFFVQEALLSQRLAERVDFVNNIEEAEEKLTQGIEYDFIIIDLEERWDTGMQIEACWRNKAKPLRLFLIEADTPLPALKKPNIVKVKPTTLAGFKQLTYQFCQEYCSKQQIIVFEG
jgi:hypothetical protein